MTPAPWAGLSSQAARVNRLRGYRADHHNLRDGAYIDGGRNRFYVKAGIATAASRSLPRMWRRSDDDAWLGEMVRHVQGETVQAPQRASQS
jgi:hypothetical protein